MLVRGNLCVRMWEFRAAWGHPEDKMASSEQTSVTWIWDVPQTVISWKLGLQGSGEAGMETLRAEDWSWRGINGFLWKVSLAHMVTAGSWLLFWMVWKGLIHITAILVRSQFPSRAVSFFISSSPIPFAHCPLLSSVFLTHDATPPCLDAIRGLCQVCRASLGCEAPENVSQRDFFSLSNNHSQI